MKKPVLFGLLFAIASTTMVSCKKTYYCECDKVYTGSSGSASYKDEVYTFDDTRARAEDKCENEEGTGTDLGGDYSRECQIR
jgi:hypothetical protein